MKVQQLLFDLRTNFVNDITTIHPLETSYARCTVHIISYAVTGKCILLAIYQHSSHQISWLAVRL